jgi:hypothetical protein
MKIEFIFGCSSQRNSLGNSSAQRPRKLLFLNQNRIAAGTDADYSSSDINIGSCFRWHSWKNSKIEPFHSHLNLLTSQSKRLSFLKTARLK